MPSVRGIVDPFGLVPLAGRVGREAGSVTVRLAGDAVLGIIDEVVASPRAKEAVDLVLDSPLGEHAAQAIIDTVLDGPFIDLAVRHAIERRVAQRVLAEVDVGPLVTEVLESPQFADAVARVLASEEVWLVVDEVASSPAVTAAITQQSVGFAGQVAGEVGVRTRKADARLERLARRLLHRAPEAMSGGPDASPATP